ncbi:hypothetical protein EYY60_15635 [Flavobacterium zhairuonense]|uniref:hypothetical protein n=1 Tax=Flavobacterium zhairuonense TaxID=2493631 RepID=UPI0010472FA9|nr:hypothetical protein [Flavobacterium zhairuonense]KAF2508559.1 hypothetical protein EYY60_15635 [Flavobacterium zhairuonense]
MNWIRKTVLFISLLIIGFFAAQASDVPMQKIESQKTDTNFSKDIPDSSAFIQPQASYQFAASIKTEYPVVAKWFDSLLSIVPQHETVKSVFNFTRQFSTQSKKITLMLYAFHFFW